MLASGRHPSCRTRAFVALLSPIATLPPLSREAISAQHAERALTSRSMTALGPQGVPATAQMSLPCRPYEARPKAEMGSNPWKHSASKNKETDQLMLRPGRDTAHRRLCDKLGWQSEKRGREVGPAMAPAASASASGSGIDLEAPERHGQGCSPGRKDTNSKQINQRANTCVIG